MDDVARHAGVGKITVSRALRTPSKVSAETLAKVEAAVGELGYVLDETAGALSSRRSRVVGCLVSTLEQPVFAGTIRGLTGGLRECGLQLLLATTQYEPETEAELIPTMLGRRPEALVLTSSEHTDPAREMLIASRIPTVEVWELPERPICAAVGFSNRDAARTITRHLVDSGRQSIAFLCVDRPGDTRARLRGLGYRDGLDGRQELHVLELDMGNDLNGPEQGSRGLVELRKRWPETDAVVCVSDALAMGVWSEAMRHGLDIPGALAIAGFGDYDFACSSGIGLTTIRVDGERIGRVAAELISAAAEGEDISGRRIDLDFELVRRATG